MKKLALLLSVIILAACGSGGGSTNANSLQGNQPQTGVMKVVLSGEADGKTMALLNYTAHSPALKYRLVVTNPTLRINGVVYSNFNGGGDDVAVGGSLPAFTLPVATGYTLEVVKYVTSGGINKVLKYGRSLNFDITEGSNSSVSITLNAVDVKVGFRGYTTATPVFSNITTANASTSQKAYKFGVVALGRYTSQFGLNPSWNMSVKQSSAKTVSPFTTYGGLGGPRASIFVDQKTPETTTQGYLFAQSEFYLKSTLLKTGESSKLFSYVYPDKSALARNVIDADVNIRLKVNAGTIPSPTLSD